VAGEERSGDRARRPTRWPARPMRATGSAGRVTQSCDATTPRRGHVEFLSTCSLSFAVGWTTKGVVALSKGASSCEGTSGRRGRAAIEAARERAHRHAKRRETSGSVAQGLALHSTMCAPHSPTLAMHSGGSRWRPARCRRRRPVQPGRDAPARTPDTRRAVAPDASSSAKDCSQRAV
jgi:hypothetical protein